MDESGRPIQGLHLVDGLLSLYPPRFRREFSAEIREVLLTRLREAQEHGGMTSLVAACQEVSGLVMSILREHWHELRTRREKTMEPNDQPQKEAGAEGGGLPALRPAGTPGVLWFTGWTLLTSAAIPASLLVMPPLAVVFMGLANLGVKAGLWSPAPSRTLQLIGFLASLALVLALVQGYLLRRFLPRAWSWFIATGAGVLFGGLASGLVWSITSGLGMAPLRYLIAIFLPMGLVLGLAQWLYLRRFLTNAFWIIFIDVLATGSLAMTGQSINSLAELIMVLVLPGTITGLGLWLLLRQSNLKMPYQVRIEDGQTDSRRLPRLARTGLRVAVLVPLFLVGIWIYAASQLTLAKSEGIYSTVEEAVIATNSQGFGGAEVVRIENVRAGPNFSDGRQPHVWFGGATVYMDRIPEGRTRDHYLAGSYYIRVREGWVFVGEGAFPEFIGWVMELYNMEAVNS